MSDAGLDESEVRARRALGLGRADAPRARNWSGSETNRRQGGNAGGSHHKSRFVQDGDVPVVMVQPRPGRNDAAAPAAGQDRSRIAELETALRRERGAREQADRSLREAQAHLRDMQTRLAHAELSRDEAIAAAERATTDRDEILARAEDARAAAPDLDEGDSEATPRRRRPAEPVGDGQSSAEPARRGRKPARTAAPLLESDKPVKWWLASGGNDADDEDDPES